MSREGNELLRRVSGGLDRPVYLVSGEAVLASPLGHKVAQALAERRGCEVQSYKRPESLAQVLGDLRTYSLFEPAKVVLVEESGLFADRAAAADLLDEAVEVVPVSDGDELTGKERRAAGQVLQVLGLFGQGPGLNPEAALDALPDWAFQGGVAFRKKRKNRPRGKKQAAEMRSGLQDLLVRAVQEELEGFAESDGADLGQVLNDGLPDGHSLVLVESHVARDHPLVVRLQELEAFADLGRLEIDRKGQVSGIARVAEELEQETGVRIAAPALKELARRTLRKVGGGRGASVAVDEESASRLAGEYRKLASMADGGTISVDLVEENVQDRGEEDVFELLDAIGSGRGDAALGKFRRRMQASNDEMADRLGLFALVAEFCRQLVAVRGMIDLYGVPAGVRHYGRFKDSLAAQLQQPLPGDEPNLLAGLHPYRLHRVYLAASRLGKVALDDLPWRVLETELRLKGESSDPDVALTELIGALCAGEPNPHWTGSSVAR